MQHGNAWKGASVANFWVKREILILGLAETNVAGDNKK